MLRGAELRGRMGEWALAWHADFVRANPKQDWAKEPTARVLESICAHGLADASDHDRRARLAVVDGSAALIPRVDRLVASRERARAGAVAAPSDEDATAIVRHAVADLARRGAYEKPCPEIVRGGAESRVPTVRDRVPLEGDLAVRMRSTS